MTTTFPAAVDSYSVKVDGVTEVLAAHVNDLQDAVVAIQNSLYQGNDNLLINGGFDVWQRTTNHVDIKDAARIYVADRWGFITGVGELTNVQRSTTVRTGARSKYSCEMVGAAGVGTVNISQRIESLWSGRYKRTLYFSGYIYNGSGASFTPKIYVSTPSAADTWTTSTVRNGGGSGEDLQACGDAAWTLVSWTADVSGYTDIGNGLEIRIETPSGSLVAGDTVRLAEFCLATLAETLYVQPNIQQEIARCQRYYSKTFAIATTPAQAVGANTGEFVFIAHAAGASLQRSPSYLFPVRMRTAPTITLYSPASASAEARDLTGGADCTSTSAAVINENQILVNATGAAGTAIGNRIGIHIAATAEL